MQKYDFGGWASKNDIRCADGRTIRRDAFKDNDGKTVPLVWQHQHDDPTNVLGHALLINKPEGIYTYGTFNDSPLAKHCKMLLAHGDICSMSIYANQLKQSGGDVLHGNIREVSLVLAPANPGASIEFVSMAHGDDIVESDDEAVLCMGDELEMGVERADEVLSHEDTGSKPEETEKRKEDKPMAEGNEKTVKDVFDSMTEEQKNVVYFMIGQALEGKGGDADDDEEENDETEDNEDEAQCVRG